MTDQPAPPPSPDDIPAEPPAAADWPAASGPPPGSAPMGDPLAAWRQHLTPNGKRFGAALLEMVLVTVTLGIGWLIWWVVLWGQGQTPAKQVLKMRIISLETGRAADWGPMAMRELVGKSLLGSVTCGITSIVGAIMILSNDERQGVWDKIAKTIVVEDPSGQFAAPA